MKARPPSTPGGRRVDLHTHTYFSDGLLSPEDLVARARERGLAAIAVTDHDTVDGIARARAAAIGGFEVVAGIEVSSATDGQDLHILGYFIDPGHGPLGERLEGFREERRERARHMIARLDGLGVSLDSEAVLTASGPGVIGRPHLAAALVRGGHASDLDDAFRRFLGLRGVAYVPRPHFEPEEAIDLIHAAHGVSVLAHPGPSVSDTLFERLVEAGLRGVEVWHPLHGPAQIRRYRALAQRFGLVETGGTDYHAQPRGAMLGDLDVPIGVLDRLKEVAGVAG